MLYTLALFAALYAATLTLMIGSGLLGSTLSLRMALEGFSEPLIGVVMAGFYIGLIGGTFVCPSIVRRVGHIRAFAAFSAANATSILLYPLFLSAPSWFVFRILTGMSMMGLYMVLESWLNDRTEPRMRGRVFSVYMAMTFLGLGTGQLLLRFRPVLASDLFMVSAIFTVLCMIPMVMTRSVHPELPETGRLDVGDLFRRAPVGLLGSLTAGAIAGAFYSLGPVFCHRSGFSVATIAHFMAATILSGLVLQWPVGNLSDRFDRLGILSALSLFVSIASVAVLTAASRSELLLMIAAVVYGGLAFTLYPVAVAHANDRVSHDEVVPASAVLILFYGLGACAGPPVASLCMKLAGPPGLYIFTASCTALLSISTLRFRLARKPPRETPAPYVPVPRTSHVISVIDPRSTPPLPEENNEEEISA